MSELKKCLECGNDPDLNESSGLIYYWYTCGNKECRNKVLNPPKFPSEFKAKKFWNGTGHRHLEPPSKDKTIAALETELLEMAEIVLFACEYYEDYSSDYRGGCECAECKQYREDHYKARAIINRLKGG